MAVPVQNVASGLNATSRFRRLDNGHFNRHGGCGEHADGVGRCWRLTIMWAACAVLLEWLMTLLIGKQQSQGIKRVFLRRITEEIGPDRYIGRSTLSFLLTLESSRVIWRFTARRLKSAQVSRLRLPLNAEYLLYLLLSKRDSEAVAGDLEERWRKIKKRFGVRRANFWYWTQVIRSLWPFGVAAVKRASGLLALIAAWKKLRG
jgi:hypothetical protein